MDLQDIIALLIVVGAAIYLGRMLLKPGQAHCGSSCSKSGCGSAHQTNPPGHLVELGLPKSREE
jgi:hypothetical protein